MGIRPAPFIKNPCGCEGFTPPLLFFDFLYLLPAKAGVTRMGGDNAVGSVSGRIRRGAPYCMAYLPKMFLLERKDCQSYALFLKHKFIRI